MVDFNIVKDPVISEMDKPVYEGGSIENLPRSYLDSPQALFDFQQKILKEDPNYFLGITDPASLFERYKADIKELVGGSKAEENFLKEIYGEKNVTRAGDGTLLFREAEGYTVAPFNPSGIDVGDIAELGGEATVALPTLGTSNPWVAAILGAGMMAEVQQYAESLPGEMDISDEEKAAQIAAEAVFGGTSQWGANKFMDFMFKANPLKNFLTNRTVKIISGKDKPGGVAYVQRGRELQEKMGEMSLGEITGDSTLQSIEGWLRSYYLTQDIAKDMTDRQVTAAAKNIQKMMATIKKGMDAGTPLGDDLVSAYESVLDGFINARKSNAADNFGKIGEVLDDFGKPINLREFPVIKTDNLVKSLEDLIKETKPGRGKTDDRLYQNLITVLDQVKEMAPKGLMTVDDFQSLMTSYGGASKGSGSVFKDLETALQRRPSSIISKALADDLDATVLDKSMDRDVAIALKKARDVYKADSELIDKFEKSFLGDFIDIKKGVSTEDIVTKMQKLDPSEINVAMKVLEKRYPELVDRVKASFFEKALERSMAPVTKMNIDQTTFGTAVKTIFDPDKFIKNLYEILPEDKIKVLFKDPKELQEVKDTLEYIQRVDFSNVSTRGGLFDFVLGFMSPTRLAVRAFGVRKMAQMLFDPKGRAGLENYINIQTGVKKISDLKKNQLGSVLYFLESFSGYNQDLADYISEFENKKTSEEDLYQEFLLDTKPEDVKPGARFPSTSPKKSNYSPMNVPRGQGFDVVPPISGPINPQTVASLESVGLPLFNAAEGGIVDLYESKKFKRPQVVA